MRIFFFLIQIKNLIVVKKYLTQSLCNQNFN